MRRSPGSSANPAFSCGGADWGAESGGGRRGRGAVACGRRGEAPSYFIHAGLVFTQVTVPYLRSEYGKEFEFDAPVKILDRLLHGM